MKEEPIWESMNSNLKNLSPLTWNYQFSIQINIFPLINNLQLISLNGPISSHHKNIPMHHNLPNIYPSLTYKAKLLSTFKNDRMILFMPYANLYQQTRTGHNKNISEHNITTSLHFSSHQTHILNFPQKKKTMKHSQEHSYFILLNITSFPNQKHQHWMSNSFFTWIMTMALTLLLILSLPWVSN